MLGSESENQMEAKEIRNLENCTTAGGKKQQPSHRWAEMHSLGQNCVTTHAYNKNQQEKTIIFWTGALCLSACRGVLRLTRLPRHDRGSVPGESIRS